MGRAKERGKARRGVVFAVALLLVALVVGVVVAHRARSGTDRPDTLVVGDSVTFLSAGPIDRALGHGSFDIIAKPGYRSAELLPVLRQVVEDRDRAGDPQRRIALLVGYNDVLRGTQSSPALTAMVRASASFDCAVWLALPSRPGGRPSANPKFGASAVDRWNARLAREIGPYRNVHLAHDWQSAVDGRGGGALVQADGVHPTIAGRRRLADAYLRALRRACA